VLKAIYQLISDNLSTNMTTMSITLELLQSILGIGLLIAATIIAEICDFKSFSKPGKLVAYFGIDPYVMQSGEFKGTRIKSKRQIIRCIEKSKNSCKMNFCFFQVSCTSGLQGK